MGIAKSDTTCARLHWTVQHDGLVDLIHTSLSGIAQLIALADQKDGVQNRSGDPFDYDKLKVLL